MTLVGPEELGRGGGRGGIVVMECVAVLAAMSGAAFARLAAIQDLNPFLWGILGVIVYAGLPVVLIWRGVGWEEAPLVWISSLGGLIVLFIVQSAIAGIKRHRGR